MGKDYGSWAVADLKNELRKRNAKLSGKKAVLVQRLQDYDSIFGDLVNKPETTYKINVPDAHNFMDINGDSMLASIRNEDMQRFSLFAEHADLTVSKNMYDEKFLLTCRTAKQGTNTYVNGICASEMRKNISYNVTAKFQNNLIIETQCECAAGMGPHAQCKHSMVLLHALIDFTTNKKIITRSSCTSNLQSFHHPRKLYRGEPVLSESFKLKRNSEILRNVTQFDPRPARYRDKENYEVKFKNYVTNYCAQENVAMPTAQLTKPANKLAMFKDHDYLPKTMEEDFIDGLKLSNLECELLEQRTRDNKKIWKMERGMRLQSSNFGKICKCTNNNKKELAKSLLINDDIFSPAIKHGLLYESTAIKKFEEQKNVQTMKRGLFVSTEYSFLGSTPDALVDDYGVLEVKCPYSAKDDMISSGNIEYLKLSEETGKFQLDQTHEYYYQIQGQPLCTQRKKVFFCVYTFHDFLIMEIDRDNEFIDAMVNKLKVFYDEHFKYVILCKHLYDKKI